MSIDYSLCSPAVLRRKSSIAACSSSPMIILLKLVRMLKTSQQLDDWFVEKITAKYLYQKDFTNSIAQKMPIILAIIALNLATEGNIEPALGSTIDLSLHQPLIAQNNVTNDLNLPKTGAEIQITNNRALTLKEAIDIALQNNRDVRVARLTIARSQAAVSQAQAAQAVQIGLTGNLTEQGSPVLFDPQIASTTSSGTSAAAKLSATYNIFTADRDASNVRAAQEQVSFDRLDLSRVEQQVQSNVVTAYYDLQAADASVLINQSAIKDAARSLSDARLQEKAGTGTKFDILSAEVQLGTANQNLTSALGTQQTTRKKIAQLLSVDNNTEFTAADRVQELGTWNYAIEDSVILAYKNRPEIQQPLVSRTIAEQRQIAAAAGDAPQVSLFGNYNLSKSLSTSVAAQDDYRVGLQLNWSFWDGGAASAGASQQQVSREIAENQFTTQRNQIRYDVERAYYSLDTNKKNILTSTQALKQAEESLKLARLRFQAGVGTQTDVITAQTNLTTARGNRVTAIVNYNRSLSSLRIATMLKE